MPDRIFADPRLATIYDDIDGHRGDREHYEAILDQLGVHSVLDNGCGTGALGCRLAARGKAIIGLDPAQASLDVARSTPGADRVTWLLGDVNALPPLDADAVTMTGNVAQVFMARRPATPTRPSEDLPMPSRRVGRRRTTRRTTRRTSGPGPTAVDAAAQIMVTSVAVHAVVNAAEHDEAFRPST